MAESSIIRCPNCDREVRPADPARPGRCPDCTTKLPPQEPDEAPLQEDGTYRLSAPEPVRRLPPQTHLLNVGETGAPPAPTPRRPRPVERRAEDKTDDDEIEYGSRRSGPLVFEPDPPPERPFVSGVFLFPWQPGTLPRWGFLTLGMTAFMFLAMVSVSLFAAAGHILSVVAAFIVLPAFWIGLWTFSYAAACSIVIIEETAAGNHTIRDWMDPNWKEWLAKLFYLGYVASIPLVAIWPLSLLLHQSTEIFWTSVGIGVFFSFPFFLLSALEQDSIFLPFSRPLASSLGRVFDGWATFYLLTGILVGLSGAAVYTGARTAPMVSSLLTGPMLAAAVLIYARLLGRLGWTIVQRVPAIEHEPEAPAETPGERDMPVRPS